MCFLDEIWKNPKLRQRPSLGSLFPTSVYIYYTARAVTSKTCQTLHSILTHLHITYDHHLCLIRHHIYSRHEYWIVCHKFCLGSKKHRHYVKICTIYRKSKSTISGKISTSSVRFPSQSSAVYCMGGQSCGRASVSENQQNPQKEIYSCSRICKIDFKFSRKSSS